MSIQSTITRQDWDEEKLSALAWACYKSDCMLGHPCPACHCTGFSCLFLAAQWAAYLCNSCLEVFSWVKWSKVGNKLPWPKVARCYVAAATKQCSAINGQHIFFLLLSTGSRESKTHECTFCLSATHFKIECRLSDTHFWGCKYL